MKRILTLLFLVLQINAAENSSLSSFYNKLESHYGEDDTITIENATNRDISVFNEHYFMTTEGKKFYHVGIVISSGVSVKIKLNRILSLKKIKYLTIYRNLEFLMYLKDPNADVDNCKTVKIEVGSKYTVRRRESGKLSITVHNKDEHTYW
ncbi:MAG: hypothetical protein P4L22_01060 [Candidatus Babeliales bacterium]|nr:hypothetical protein [Candidatus Babeliales bacterium]